MHRSCCRYGEKDSRMKKALRHIVPVLLCLVAGAVAGSMQTESLAEWYPSLAKSPLTPPAIAFPVAWTLLYICMGLSLGRVLTDGDKRFVTLWFLQLAVNFLWSFFGQNGSWLCLVVLVWTIWAWRRAPK